jgi:hypothetical protein
VRASVKMGKWGYNQALSRTFIRIEERATAKKRDKIEEVKIVRPERIKLSREESLKRMREFPKRKGKFIAATRTTCARRLSWLWKRKLCSSSLIRSTTPTRFLGGQVRHGCRGRPAFRSQGSANRQQIRVSCPRIP